MPTQEILVLPLVLGRTKTTLPYLALGMVTAYLRQCQANGQLGQYRIGRIFPAGYMGAPHANVYKRVLITQDPVCLLSSYVWNHELNIEVAEHIRKISPGALIIFGGPHVPKYEGETEIFLQDHPFIDIAVLGEGEAACAEILDTLAGTGRDGLDTLGAVEGIVFSHKNAFTRTPARQRTRDLQELPSPYLTGELDLWLKDYEVTVLETNRGCPYGCTYCDWGSATLEKVTKFTPERVISEIEYLAQRRSQTIFVADANFGMLEQDIEIAHAMVDIKKKTGYPLRVMTNFAKNGGRRLMAVIKILHEGGLLPTGIIALQTTDPDVLKVIARDNIKTQSYEKMMGYFNSENIPMASDLMIGLPGQTVDSFADDLQFCFNWKVAAGANYTSMMPNAPMAERSYRQRHAIVVDENNMIQSTATFSANDMDYMKKLYTTYLFHVKFGVLKYILYYLQLQHGIQAITFLRRWLARVIEDCVELPVSVRIFNEIFCGSIHNDWAMLVWGENANFLFENTEAYYSELLLFSMREFDIEISDSEWRTLAAAQQAVMPRVGRAYPYIVELEHDINGYVAQIKSVPSMDILSDKLQPLAEFCSGELTVTADEDILQSTVFKVVGSHAEAWELPSPLRFF